MELVYAFGGLALGLTILMFAVQQAMLGAPSAMFWALLCGRAYQLSATTWDIYYLLFFASFGMVVFCLFGAYGLRKKLVDEPWADEGSTYVDEVKGDGIETAERAMDDDFGGPSKPSQRTVNLRKRASDRRTQGIQKKGKNSWGEFG